MDTSFRPNTRVEQKLIHTWRASDRLGKESKQRVLHKGSQIRIILAMRSSEMAWKTKIHSDGIRNGEKFGLFKSPLRLTKYWNDTAKSMDLVSFTFVACFMNSQFLSLKNHYGSCLLTFLPQLPISRWRALFLDEQANFLWNVQWSKVAAFKSFFYDPY